MSSPFAEFIRNLPEADLPLPGAKGFLLGGPQAQAVFFELEAGAKIPIHTHGDQWGVVVRGEIDFTIDGVKQTRVSGDYYFVPGGAPHGGEVKQDSFIVEVFSDADRWKPK